MSNSSEARELKPAIRFAGYTDDWEQRKLADHATIKGRLGWKSLKQDEYTTTGPSMIAGKHISNGKVNWNVVDHIPQWRYDESPEIALEDGDVIFSKDGSLGNPALIKNLHVPATINSTMMLVRTDKLTSSEFFYEILLSDLFKKLIYLKVSGSSIPHLFQADMKNFTFMAPTLAEQTKVSRLLNKTDHLIAANERKGEALKKLKNALLQRMFVSGDAKVPNIRFAGYTDAWEQRKLKDISTEIGTGKSSFNKLERSTINSYKILGSTSIIGFTDSFDYEGDFILTARVGANAGNIYRESGKVKISDNTVYIKAKEINFLFYILKNFNLKKLSFGTGQPLIKSSELRKLKLKIPLKLQEKERIGLLLEKLDNLIAANERKGESLKKLKQALLQKMFV